MMTMTTTMAVTKTATISCFFSVEVLGFDRLEGRNVQFQQKDPQIPGFTAENHLACNQNTRIACGRVRQRRWTHKQACIQDRSKQKRGCLFRSIRAPSWSRVHERTAKHTPLATRILVWTCVHYFMKEPST